VLVLCSLLIILNIYCGYSIIEFKWPLLYSVYTMTHKSAKNTTPPKDKKKERKEKTNLYNFFPQKRQIIPLVMFLAMQKLVNMM